MNSLPLALGVGLFGGLGAVVRFLVHRGVALHDPRDFPLGTFIVNVAGAFAIGVLAGAAVGGDTRLLVAVGFLGGLTTFSTWMFESERLAADGYPRGAVMNIAFSTAVGFAAVAAGHALGAAL